jgi:hypothetical protein
VVTFLASQGPKYPKTSSGLPGLWIKRYQDPFKRKMDESFRVKYLNAGNYYPCSGRPRGTMSFRMKASKVGVNLRKPPLNVVRREAETGITLPFQSEILGPRQGTGDRCVTVSTIVVGVLLTIVSLAKCLVPS